MGENFNVINKTTFNMRLVEAVELYPCLYNYTLAEYSRKDVSEAAWEMVAEKVGTSVRNCKERWKHLRTVFVRKLNAGYSSKLKKPYYLNNALSFILPYVKRKILRSDGNVSPPSLTSSTYNSETKHEFDFISVNKSETPDPIGEFQEVDDPMIEVKEKSSPVQPGNISPASFSSSTNNSKTNNEFDFVNKKETSESSGELQEANEPKKKSPRIQIRKRKHKETEDNPKSAQTSENTRQCEDDGSRKMFLLSLLPEIQDFTEPQMKIFKRRVLNLIDEIVDYVP